MLAMVAMRGAGSLEGVVVVVVVVMAVDGEKEEEEEEEEEEEGLFARTMCPLCKG